jgi:hypothetical protein
MKIMQSKFNKFNLIYEAIMSDLISEGGNAFDNVVGIKKENIKPTIDLLEKLLFKPLGINKNLWTSELGSTGKKDISGDIDIAVNMSELMPKLDAESVDEVKKIILNKLKELNIDCKKVSSNIHLKFPIQGSQKNEFVQIDIFNSSNLEFLKQKMFSPKGTDSKYKGAHRSSSLNSIFKEITLHIAEDAVDDEKNEFISPDGKKYPGMRFSYIAIKDDGFFQITKTFKGKHGILKTAKSDDTQTKFITDSFQEMLDILFGKGKYTPNDLYSFETIWNNILMDSEFPYKNKLDDIVISLYHLYNNDERYNIPDEIIEYLDEHNIKVN